jgi:dUTP pyrophosphatase
MSGIFQIKKLIPSAKVPTRGSAGAVGYDLYSSEALEIAPGERALVGTGISMRPPLAAGPISASSGLAMSVYGRVAPRSGLAVKKGIHVGAGVVDPDYTGEVKVLIFNNGKEPFCIEVHDRIAQLVLECCMVANPQLVEEDLETTDRGTGGFGSTDVHF